MNQFTWRVTTAAMDREQLGATRPRAGRDANFSVIVMATDPDTDTFVDSLSIPVHGVAAPAIGI